MENLYFIKAPCHQSDRYQGFQFAPDEIKEQYNYELTTSDFDGSSIDPINGIKLCSGYQKLYNHIINVNINKKIITIGGDQSVSSATISALNDKHNDNLKIIWIDAYPDIDTFETSISKNLNEMSIASILGILNPSFVNQKYNHILLY